MKVIFLDIDGVLNTPGHLYHYGLDYIDEGMTELFSGIVRATGSEIVLSSSWRLEKHSKKTAQKALGEFGLEILDITPSILGPRGREILAWLEGRPVEAYAVIDDNPDAGFGTGKNFFKTDPEKGLDDMVAEKIIKHLGLIA